VQRGVKDLDDWELRLEELGLSGSVCSYPGLSDGERMVSTVGERDIGLGFWRVSG
jgi:hypothetical protein